MASFNVTLSDNIGAQESFNVKNPVIGRGVTYGVATYSVLWPNNTTPVQIKTSGGRIKTYSFFNGANAIRYVRLYDQLRSPLQASDTPFWRVGIPATAEVHLPLSDGLPFMTALWIAVTTGVADTDTTAPSANDVIINMSFI
jgi:hypothetical protein